MDVKRTFQARLLPATLTESLGPEYNFSAITASLHLDRVDPEEKIRSYNFLNALHHTNDDIEDKSSQLTEAALDEESRLTFSGRLRSIKTFG